MKPQVLPLLLSLATGACATSGSPTVQLAPPTPLELREVQTRRFEDAELQTVLKAVIGVLQDEGFVVHQADAQLGLVTAVRQWQSGQENKALKVFKVVGAFYTWGATLLIPSGRTEFSSLEVSFNLTQDPSGVRVRVGLVSKVVDKKGAVVRTQPVADAGAYQGLLVRVDKAVFLQQEGL